MIWANVRVTKQRSEMTEECIIIATTGNNFSMWTLWRLFLEPYHKMQTQETSSICPKQTKEISVLLKKIKIFTKLKFSFEDSTTISVREWKIKYLLPCSNFCKINQTINYLVFLSVHVCFATNKYRRERERASVCQVTVKKKLLHRS